MGIMRWTLLERVRLTHPHLPVENTFGYLTKHKRLALGLPKTHCADAFCIAGNLKAQRTGVYLYQKQTRKHNRQIHKCSILKGGVRKLNQSPYLVEGFRLFDKVKCLGQVGRIVLTLSVSLGILKPNGQVSTSIRSRHVNTIAKFTSVRF